MPTRRPLSALSVLKGTMSKVKHLKEIGLTLAISATLLGASDIANAQGRRGRGEIPGDAAIAIEAAIRNSAGLLSVGLTVADDTGGD